MGAVQQGLDTLALYPRGTKDVNKKNTDLPYPMLTVSPYPELSLNEWYQMYESAEEPLFLNYLYPYILDSLGFPSVMASVAKRLDPSCQVQWDTYHYLVDVTKDGETRTYGGAGSGGNDPLYSNRVEKLSRAYVSYSSNVWAGGVTKDELPEDMVLTLEQVAALQVDRNTDVIPAGLVYDGTAYPGTPYGQ